MHTLGDTIQTLRKNKNLTQGQLAEVLSVTAQSVSKWENDLSAPDITLLPIIARFFGITMDELFHYRLDALNEKERFIRFMADNGVLRFGEFRLKSGRVSPYLIDTGRYQSASQMVKLGEFYAQCMRENNVESNLLLANARREIPIMLSTGMVLYNHYGVDMRYSIDDQVGKPPAAGDRLTLIKDTLTSGHSLRATLETLQKQTGQQVKHIIVSMDRMEKASHSPLTARQALEKQFGVQIHAIATLDDLIRTMKKGIVGNQEQLEAVCRYREVYGGVADGD